MSYSITFQTKPEISAWEKKDPNNFWTPKWPTKEDPTLCPKTSHSFMLSIYLGHTKLICYIFFHGFLVCKFENRDTLFSGWKTGKKTNVFHVVQWKKTIIKNETVQRIHDTNKNWRTLSTLSTIVKQKLLINNFDTHM